MPLNQLDSLRSKTTLLIIVSAACFGASIISPALPYISKYLGINNNQAGMLISIYLLGYLCGQFFYSMLSKKLGYRCSLLTGFSIYFISSLGQLTAINWHLIDFLSLCRFFCAFGASSGLVCSFAMINEFFNKKDSQKLISLAFISLTIFSYLSITIGSIISQIADWRAIFYLIPTIAIINTIMIYKFIPDLCRMSNPTEKNSLSFLKTYCKSIVNIRLLLTSIIVAFTTTTTYVYATIAPAISYNILLISPNTFGMISMLNLIGLLIGGYLCSFFSKKYKALNILMLGLLTASIPITFFLLYDNLIFRENTNGLLFFTLTACLNFALGLIYPSASYLALNSVKCNATSSSIMNIIKIGLPTIVISIIAKSNLSLINSFKIPVSVFFIMALVSLCILKLIGLLKTS